MNMWKLDIPQVLISGSTIFGISLIWYDFNVKVFHTVRDLSFAILYDKDEDAEADEDEEVDD